MCSEPGPVPGAESEMKETRARPLASSLSSGRGSGGAGKEPLQITTKWMLSSTGGSCSDELGVTSDGVWAFEAVTSPAFETGAAPWFESPIV